MKRIFFYALILICFAGKTNAQQPFTGTLPDSLSSGNQGAFHVQGVAVDQAHGYIYLSFTNKLLKMDRSGHVIGSVTGFVGHLGDLAFDPESGKIYGSLEFKDDAIGKGISKKLGLKNSDAVNFYIAVFDTKAIVRPNMKAEEDNLLHTVYLKEVVDDYTARVRAGDQTVEHRFGCSGIDGVTLAPAIGKTGGKQYLYVAYGIYGDTARKDNNNQVILKYDISHWDALGRKLTQETPHHSGPKKPSAKYFVYTGNTTYGIQNLAYDPQSGNFFAAVYPGKKARFPNYSLFVIDGHKKPFKRRIVSDGKKMKVRGLSLLEAGGKDADTGIRGWHFKWGATGLFPLGQGLFYISHNRKTAGQQATTLYKYQWVGNSQTAFSLVR